MENIKKDLTPDGGAAEVMAPERLAKEIVSLLDEKQAHDILLYHVTDVTVITDYYVVCTGRSTTHVKSLTDDLLERMEEKGLTAAHVEGRGGGTWILLDFSSVIVHIFTRDTRDFYKLERLFPAEGKVDISDILTPEGDQQ